VSAMLETMLQALRLGAADRDLDAGAILQAVRNTQTDSGGFADRSGDADLYYAAFALKLLIGLEGEFNRLAATAWVAGFGHGDDLDLVHFSCLVRARVLLGTDDEPFTAAAKARLEKTTCDNLYEMLLCLWASDDLNLPTPPSLWPDRVLAAQTPAGGFANVPNGAATTPTTAAAMILLNKLGQPLPVDSLTFLTEQCHDGAFRAAPIAPVGDLLSTSVALQTLTPLPPSLDRGAIRNFVLSTRTTDGLFAALPGETGGDVEYTFYGLLAMGCLCEEPAS